jgi:hypothetical protein
MFKLLRTTSSYPTVLYLTLCLIYRITPFVAHSEEMKSNHDSTIII